MKFTEERPFANIDTAVRKLLEIANGLEADYVGRLQVGDINGNSCAPAATSLNTPPR